MFLFLREEFWLHVYVQREWNFTLLQSFIAPKNTPSTSWQTFLSLCGNFEVNKSHTSDLKEITGKEKIRRFAVTFSDLKFANSRCTCTSHPVTRPSNTEIQVDVKEPLYEPAWSFSPLKEADVFISDFARTCEGIVHAEALKARGRELGKVPPRHSCTLRSGMLSSDIYAS